MGGSRCFNRSSALVAISVISIENPVMLMRETFHVTNPDVIRMRRYDGNRFGQRLDNPNFR
jgi:hypothetical protein